MKIRRSNQLLGGLVGSCWVDSDSLPELEDDLESGGLADVVEGGGLADDWDGWDLEGWELLAWL